MVYKLCVGQFSVFIAEHHIGPVEVEHRYISQVDDVVSIAVDVVAAVVELVERNLIEGAEHETQNTVDDGSSSVGVPSCRNHRAPPDERSGTVRTGRRGQRTTPVVMRVVPAELIAVVMVAVVKAVVGIITVVATVSLITSVVATMSLVTAVVAVAAGAVAVSMITTIAMVAITVISIAHVAVTVVAVAGVSVRPVAATVTIATTGVTAALSAAVYMLRGALMGDLRLAVAVTGNAATGAAVTAVTAASVVTATSRGTVSAAAAAGTAATHLRGG